MTTLQTLAIGQTWRTHNHDTYYTIQAITPSGSVCVSCEWPGVVFEWTPAAFNTLIYVGSK